jgi:hypothetical protein
MSDVSIDPDEIFAFCSTAPITAPSFNETSEFAPPVAVVEMSSLCEHEKPLREECNNSHENFMGHITR